MPKDVDAQIQVEIDASEKAPIIMVEMFLDGLTLRYALQQDDVTFPSGGSAVYSARTFGVSDVVHSVEGQIQRMKINFDDVNGDFKAYDAAYDFQGRDIQVKRIYRSGESELIPSDGDIFQEHFYGQMELPGSSQPQTFAISAVSGQTIQVKVLDQSYGNPCQRKFGNDMCTIDLDDPTLYYKNGTAESGDVGGFIDTALTQADDYFNFGRVEVTQGGTTYGRKVKNFIGNGSGEIEFDIDTPVAIDNTATYKIWKGCDKKWDTCKGLEAYGSDGDNTANFFGFIHVGSNRESNASPAASGGGTGTFTGLTGLGDMPISIPSLNIGAWGL